MKKDYTHISIVLDRSASMSIIKTSTINAFNKFLEDQKAVPGDATISLVQFNNAYAPTYENINIQSAEPLSDSNFLPNGNTALLDAIGKCINTTGSFLGSLSEDQRPEKVVFVVLTDGEENSSREFSSKQISEMIKHQREVYSWEFVFLAAGENAIEVGESYGFSSDNSVQFGATEFGMGENIDLYSKKLTSFRRSLVSDMSYSKGEREELLKTKS